MKRGVKGGLVVLAALAAFVGVLLVIGLSGRDEARRPEPPVGERTAEPSVTDGGTPPVDVRGEQIADAAPLAYADDPANYPAPAGPGDVLGPGEAWGEAVEGIQVRLRADKTLWRVGEPPSLTADVRNLGERNLSVAQAQQLCEVEFDGQWYRWAGPLGLKSSAFGPGREYKDIRIVLDEHWQSKLATGIRQGLELAVGKHTVRVAFIAQPNDGALISQAHADITFHVQVGLRLV